MLLLATLMSCSEAPAPAPVVAPPPPLPPVAVQGPREPGLAGVKARGVLKVAADPDAPPFLSTTKEGSLDGFEYSIMKAIADRAGVNVKIVPAKFEDLVDTVKKGEADLAIGQLSQSAAWSGVSWSVSYLQYSFCLVVPAESTIKGMADLKAKRVGMYDDPVARQLADVLVGAPYDRVLYSDYGYFEKMMRNQLDAMVYDCPLAHYEMSTFGDKLKIVDDSLNVASYAAVVPMEDSTLLGEVNGVIQDLGQQGLLAVLADRYLGQSAKTDDFESDAGKVVVVKKGETLSIIAGRTLKNAEKWKELYAANKDVIGPDANLIYAGMRLRLPR
ncbi:MAG TPA: transporter substrate-binding domain-containing protein [Myxococcota bacterium]|nr:transporter substrate-binding domain-containing protein [Myxococcota bacterium]